MGGKPQNLTKTVLKVAPDKKVNQGNLLRFLNNNTRKITIVAFERCLSLAA